MRETLTVYSEPLLADEFVQYQHLVPLLARLAQDYEVTLAAPAISRTIQADLGAKGIRSESAGVWFPAPRNRLDEAPSFVVSWMRDAILATNRRWSERLGRSRDGLRLNFSMTNSAPSDIWYIQSQPLADSVRMIVPNFTGPYRWAGQLGLPVIEMLGSRHISRTADGAGRIYAQTRYVGEAYQRYGYRVDGLVSGFLYPSSFTPSTASPRRDYALAYLGKETDMRAIRGLVHLGVPVKIFGGKSAELVQGTLREELDRLENVEMCGRVSHRELCELYSNALFTAFPFTDESFGCVPVESMACGTPVLTYAAQGPGETVVDGFTGWLAHGPVEFLEAADRLFHRGYPRGMQSACVERASQFSLDSVANRWRQVLRSELDGSAGAGGPTLPKPRSSPMDSFLPIRELVGPYRAAGGPRGDVLYRR